MKKRAFNLAMVVAAVLAIGFFVFGFGAGDISGSEARRLVEDGARLVDVRTPQEYAAGHIPGAVNIPVQELDRRMAELGPKEAPIVLYCRTGRRSGHAAGMLKSAGYAAIHDLGGMSQW